MIFYIILLTIAVVITIALAWGIVHFAHCLKRNDAKKPTTFFIPSLLTVFLILHIYFALLPVFLDAPQLLSGNRELRSISFVEHRIPWIMESSTGEMYFYDPFSMKLQADVPYLVAYGKNSHFIVDASPLNDSSGDAAQGDAGDEVQNDSSTEVKNTVEPEEQIEVTVTEVSP